MALILIRPIFIALSVVTRVALSPLRNLYLHGSLLFIRVLNARMPIQTEKSRTSSVAFSDSNCPYEYILEVYGRNHFENIVKNLDPDLQTRDPALFALTLEIMDAIHFGAILVDDIADNSMLRKGKPAAHLLFGSSETINRAYLRICEVLEKCVKERPSLVPFILENLRQIHKGIDTTMFILILNLLTHTDRRSRHFACLAPGWTRALPRPKHSFEYIQGMCIPQNRRSIQTCWPTCLWVSWEGQRDEWIWVSSILTHLKSTRFLTFISWYCHLQNDCKNLYSSDVVAAKGKLAEDLLNKEYSFPIIVALNSSAHIANPVGQALQKTQHLSTFRQKKLLQAALEALQESEVKSKCLGELEELKSKLYRFAGLWGRQEAMNFQPVGSKPWCWKNLWSCASVQAYFGILIF